MSVKNAYTKIMDAVERETRLLSRDDYMWVLEEVSSALEDRRRAAELDES